MSGRRPKNPMTLLENMLDLQPLRRVHLDVHPNMPYRVPNKRVRKTINNFGDSRADRANLSEEARLKQMAGLVKTWDARVRRGTHGEKIMPDYVKKKIAVTMKKINTPRQRKFRARERLVLTVAKEAREIQDMARQRATAVMERLTDIALNSPIESVAVAAGNVVLDRAYGRASQTNINANIDANGKANEIDAKELDTRISTALKRVEAITGTVGRKAKAPKGEERPADVRVDDRDTDGSTFH